MKSKKYLKCRSCNYIRSSHIYTSPLLPEYIWPTKLVRKKMSSCKVYFCRNCSTYQLQNFTSKKIKSFYGSNSFNEENEIEKKKRLKKILKKYGVNFFDKKKILDIGGGINEFSSLIKKRNNEVTILDFKISSKAKKYADKSISMDFEKSNLKSNSFDIILMFHTLEHMKNPNKVCSKIKDILKPNGLLIVEIPNIDYYIQNLFYYSFFHQHLNMYGKRSLKNTLEHAGFKKQFNLTENNSVILFSFKKKKISVKNKKYKELHLKNFKQKLTKCKKLVDKVTKEKKIFAFFGAGGSSSLFLSYFTELKNKIKFIIDNDKNKSGLKILDIDAKIKPYNKQKIDVPVLFINKNLYKLFKNKFKYSKLLNI